jgi:hypothetical protein
VDSAVAGLIGVAVGAVVTGGVQAVGTWLNRRVASRTAARLLYDSFLNAIILLASRIETSGWGPESDGWEALDAAWVANRVDLARVLSTRTFMDVSAAVTGFNKMADRHAQGTAFPVVTAPTFLNLLIDAEQHVWHAAWPWWFKDRTTWWPKKWKLPPSGVSEVGLL